ncbi:hypothetical protein BCR33DRAFT_457502 [Rhizoclosmatium globosum]|uniref:Uncharacterized protein n=1 Tax=Rhizoclosmatium globosum TaxID=329046 RepID=A0A1Y2CX03_9FUNG|nr:hypothetical protein BCR33DRAFT_457502 [Rhizoclosmatium globosum]|eukprot:ORY51507.1 hypothetical protein BCR33DRAFT_457502 [Rhizoclosmatium globosum]
MSKDIPGRMDDKAKPLMSPQQAQFLSHQQEQQTEAYMAEYYQPTEAEMQRYYQQQQQYQQTKPILNHIPGSRPIPPAIEIPSRDQYIATKESENPEEILTPKSRPWVQRYLCCCCPKKRKHRILCCAATVSILIAIGVLLYFYVPRFPDIKVYNINLENIASMNTPYYFSYKDPNNEDLNQLILRMNLTMYLGTYNPNLYDLKVDEINLVANLVVNQTFVYNALKTSPLVTFSSLVQAIGIPKSPLPVGYVPSNNSQIGTAKTGNILFPSKTWINYTMMFEFEYSPGPEGLLKDPTILELADACGITSRYKPAGRNMRIHYDALSTIGVLKPLNYAPGVSNELQIVCPFSQDQIQAVIREVQDNGKSPQEAIAIVFKGSPKNVNKRVKLGFTF